MSSQRTVLSSPSFLLLFFATSPASHTWHSTNRAKILINVWCPRSKGGHCILTREVTSVVRHMHRSTEEWQEHPWASKAAFGSRDLNLSEASLLEPSLAAVLNWTLCPVTGCCSSSCVSLSRTWYCTPCCSTVRHLVADKRVVFAPLSSPGGKCGQC